MPLSCCTLKVSVTTRWPRTKTPNEPESTCWGPFGRSFLSESLSEAHNKAVHARTATAPHRTRAIRFTAFLPVFRGFDLGPELLPPPPQSPRWSFRWSPAGAMPSGNMVVAPYKDPENLPDCRAEDAPFHAAPPASGTSATIPPRSRPRTPWGSPPP